MKPTTRQHTELIRGRQDLRKIFHIAIGMFGFLYPFMGWEIILVAWIIALFCAWFLPARLEAFEVLLSQEEKKRGLSPAMMSYAIVMIAATLLFRDSMKDSALILLSALAFGDGFSALVGMNVGGTSIPYNQKKTIAGTFAFVIFGVIGALALIFFFAAFTIKIPSRIGLGSFPILRILIVTTVCAIAETIPLKIPDNILIGIAGIIALFLTMNLYH